MNANNGWPGKPGVPLNPEEPGYHWVKGCDGEDTIVFWRGHGGDTHYENGDLKKLDHWSGHPMWIAQDWVYLAPCLTPDEAAALQKRVVQLEGLGKSLATERNKLIGVLQLAVEQSAETGENEPAWIGPACRILNAGFTKIAALEEGKKNE